ncbi:MAG: sigma-54 dependent transcriptional regulator [Rikenellaceae bacterium]|jgi:transcriptional regulator with PAS, ATPase and Fis domain|nr:sigma-54 dependent transcriptional regulator [Rikenellaceae bacterium]
MDIQPIKQRFGIIGNNPGMNHALEVALRVAPTDLSVLITGESGVGKEFFPQIIHACSPRKHNTYIAVNCGAIPEGTIDSELFGHEKGSFTGAFEARKGYFEVADGGTIFLDEVAELPLTTQVRLLRVLQTGEFIKVGSSKIQKTNVRVVAATNLDLMQAIGDGKFREDLYYRLNTVPIVVPEMRKRKEDIHLLFRKFATDIAQQYRMPVITLDDGARQMLESYAWPGNVRQLKNVAEQISAIEEARMITADILKKYLPDVTRSNVPAIYRGNPEDQYRGSDRDLLYKVLFDMRGEIHDLKRLIVDLASGKKYDTKPDGFNPNYALPTSPAYYTPPAPEFAETEDVTDDAPAEAMTKEKAQREQILKALKHHGGKRREAAKDLFISERTLYRKLKELGIDETETT